jgi:hypothetical protein
MKSEPRKFRISGPLEQTYGDQVAHTAVSAQRGIGARPENRRPSEFRLDVQNRHSVVWLTLWRLDSFREGRFAV